MSTTTREASVFETNVISYPPRRPAGPSLSAAAEVLGTVESTAKTLLSGEPITARAVTTSAVSDVTKTGLKKAVEVVGAEAGRRAVTQLAVRQAATTIPAVQAVLAGTASTDVAVRLVEQLERQGARGALVSTALTRGLGVFIAPAVAALRMLMDDEEHELDEYVRVVGVKTAGSVAALACSVVGGPAGVVAGIGVSMAVERELEARLDGR